MSSLPFLPLSRLFPDAAGVLSLIPIAGLGGSPLDGIGITGIDVVKSVAGTMLSGTLTTAPGREIVLAMPGFPDLTLVLSDLASVSVLIAPVPSVHIAIRGFAVRLPRELFRPVIETEAGWMDIGGPPAQVPVRLGGTTDPITVTLDGTGAIRVTAPLDTAGAPLALVAALADPVMIGNTGLVITATGLGFSLDPNDPMLTFAAARLLLPQGLRPNNVVLPDLVFTGASLSRRGFSGTLEVDWNLSVVNGEVRYTGLTTVGGSPTTVPASMFGLNGGLERVAVRLVDGAPQALALTGRLRLPFFEDIVAVELGVVGNGALTVRVSGSDDAGLVLTREGLFSMRVTALGVVATPTEKAVTVSGAFRPAFFASDGLGWPEIGIEGLRAGLRDGNPFVEVDGGWIDLRDQAVFDLYGFRGELSRIGFGREGTRHWMGISGSVQLIELLPIGAAVEGARVLWDPTIDVAALTPAEIVDALTFELSGLAVQHSIPGTLEFAGSAYFLNEGTIRGFGGDLRLQLPTIGLGVAAGLLVGINSEAPPYPFLFISLEVDLPAGIPLGQSGLALKGAAGLVGYNVFPRRTESENWYEEWYKRPPEVGVLHSTKWAPLRDGLAFGAGVTITTADGYVKGVRALLALLLPGPVVLFEGRALFLAGLRPDAEPPLRMLALLDGSQGTLQLNVEAQAELVPDTVRAAGGLEGFFDVDDVTRWHIYLGQDDPPDRRIRATVFDLFEAGASLMLDNDRTRLAASIELIEEFRYSLVEDTVELALSVDASIEGHARLDYRPEQVEGSLALQAAIGLTAPGIDFGVSASAEVTARGPSPLIIDFTVAVEADLPWPLPDFGTEMRLHWDEPVAPAVSEPLAAMSAGNDRTGPDVLLTLHSARTTDGALKIVLPPAAGRTAAEAAPVLPLDAKVLLTFSGPVNDVTGAFFRDTSTASAWHDLGRFRATTMMLDVAVYVHDASTGWTSTEGLSDAAWDEENWRLAYCAVPAPAATRLRGVWLADQELDGSPPGARRLRLWSRDPFTRGGNAREMAGSGRELVVRHAGHVIDLDRYPASTSTTLSMPSYAEGFLAGHPSFGSCVVDAAEPECIRFDTLPEGAKAEGIVQSGIRISGSQLRVTEGSLRGEVLDIEFPEPVVRVRLGYQDATLPAPTNVTAARPMTVAEYGTELATWKTAATVDVVRYRVLVTKDRRTEAERTEMAALGTKLVAMLKSRPVWSTSACGVAVPSPNVTVAGNTLEVRVVDGHFFRCLHIQKHVGRLVEICVTTARSVASQRAQKALCASNERALVDGAEQVLAPRMYYRVVVSGRVDVELMDLGLPDGMPPAAAELLLDVYRLIADATPSANFVQEAYFRTVGPPTDLTSYVRWTTPGSGSDAVWTDQDVAVGFLRGTLSAMFPNPPHTLAVEIRDAEGVRHGDLRPVIFTLPAPLKPLLSVEEELWLARLAKAGIPYDPGGDDLMFASVGALRPRTRYEMRVVDRWNPGHPLLSVAFVTSRFAGFSESFGPDATWSDRPLRVPASGVAALNRSALRDAVGAAAAARYHETYVAGCRLRGAATLAEADTARQSRVKEDAALDSTLRASGELLGLAGRLIAAPPLTFTAFRVVSEIGASVGFLFLAPEPVDWRQTLQVTAGASATPIETAVGRVTLSVRTGGVAVNGLLVPNGDRTRAVLLFEPGSVGAGAVQFDLTFIHDGRSDGMVAPLRRTGAADPLVQQVVRHYG